MTNTLIITVKAGLVQSTDANEMEDLDVIVLDLDYLEDPGYSVTHQPTQLHPGLSKDKMLTKIGKAFGRVVTP